MNPTLLFFLTLEALAFILSVYFHLKNRSKSSFYLSIFLGFIVLIEIVGSYTVFIEEIEAFQRIKWTVWEKNYWLYNIQLIVSALFYTSYFKIHLTSKTFKVILNTLLAVFLTGSILFLIFSGTYFTSFSPFTLIMGTLMIIISISMYYLELLQSDLILNVTRSITFYISIGALIFHLCTPPLFLYSMYFSISTNPEFVTTYKVIIFGSNFIMYTIYILGFIICARNRKPY